MMVDQCQDIDNEVCQVTYRSTENLVPTVRNLCNQGGIGLFHCIKFAYEDASASHRSKYGRKMWVSEYVRLLSQAYLEVWAMKEQQRAMDALDAKTA